MLVDHIIPEAQGGPSTFPNLCFTCRRCNACKGPVTRIQESFTGDLAPLLHPRQHAWTAHFAWDAAGIRLLGLTAIGRATIIALNINNEVIILDGSSRRGLCSVRLSGKSTRRLLALAGRCRCPTCPEQTGA